MGITNPQFPNENCPQGNCALLECDPVPDPEDNGEDVEAFTDFMSFLAAPSADDGHGPDDGFKGADHGRGREGNDAAGEQAFRRVGCVNCHTPELTTGPTAVAALDRKTFTPYSDFLLHDMGRLGDGIAQGAASTTQMRTAPLWGARARTRFLHDGRATNVREAILAHDGQGTAAVKAFLSLPAEQQAKLLDFVSHL